MPNKRKLTVAPDGMACCDLCDQDFGYWVPIGMRQDDVFYVIQKVLGYVVCPDCLRKAAERI